MDHAAKHKKTQLRLRQLIIYWLSVIFKVIQGPWFHLIWKSVCDFLLVINSNLDAISQRFRDTDRTTLR